MPPHPQRIFYDHGSVIITERWLSVGQYRYRIDGMDNLRRTRTPTDLVARLATAVAVVSTVTLPVIGAFLTRRTLLVFAGALAAAPTVLAAVRAVCHPPEHQLWAEYQGHTVQLYRTTNGVEFGKVTRALVRASSLR